MICVIYIINTYIWTEGLSLLYQCQIAFTAVLVFMIAHQLPINKANRTYLPTGNLKEGGVNPNPNPNYPNPTLTLTLSILAWHNKYIWM